MNKKQQPKEPQNIEKIEQTEIAQEMRESYLAYALSVIISRAIPDVRDGLKPVQRRILYSMYDSGLHYNSKTVKSARIVGDTLGKYHPHGDVAVYDALVRMAQPFSLRYPLIIGQGNFGSIDGDPPAAERYTEAKLSKIAEEMMQDLEKNTVNFVNNYDNTRLEPSVLPTKIPTLLLNGTTGIAVGMATNIPPHNLSEVVEALKFLVGNPQKGVEDLLKFIKGPDFPTGGIIYNQQDLLTAYSTGKGSIVIRGKAEIENRKKDKDEFNIVITEIPYEVNKANLVLSIANLVENKKIEGIKDIRDESDKEGLRIVVELKSTVNPTRVLNQLYKYTDLEKKYHFNMLALVGGIQPKTLSLKEILEEFLAHREQVIINRTKFDLEKTRERIHILLGLVKALDHLDEIIKTIRASKDRDSAKNSLMAKFKLTAKQSEAILIIRLESLARLERQKIYDELKEKQQLEKELAEILKNPQKVKEIIIKELDEIKQKYPDLRRTQIIKEQLTQINEEELVPDETSIITLSQNDYLRRLRPETFKLQKRGGKGIISYQKEDQIKEIISSNNRSLLMLFSDLGKIYYLKTYEIPLALRTNRGKHINNFLNLASHEKIVSIVSYRQDDENKNEFNYLVLATKKGLIKKIKLTDLISKIRSGIRVINIKKDDSLVSANFTSGKDEILLATKNGMIIKFKESDLRPLGRNSSGVKGINLKNNDELLTMEVVSDYKTQKLLIVTAGGYAKITSLKEIKNQKRGGVGIKIMKLTDKTKQLSKIKIIRDEEEMLAISQLGQTIRISLDSLPTLKRTSQGVKIMKLEANDLIKNVTLI